MLSFHVAGVVQRRLTAGVRVPRPHAISKVRIEGQKRPFTLRNFGTASEAPPPYKASYDVRNTEKTRVWPRSRAEELAQLAKEVHPDAKQKKASPNTFSYNVRLNEQVVPSKPSRTIEAVQGLLKPPAIMQKTDPFVLQMHQKRKLARQDLFAVLRAETDSLTIDQINDTYEKLRTLDLEDIQDGFEPQYFSRERLLAESINGLPPAINALLTDQNTSKRSLNRQEGDRIKINSVNSSSSVSHALPNYDTSKSILSGSNQLEDWTLANNQIRRKFILDLIANYDEHLEMSSSQRIIAPKQTVVQFLNTLTLPRLFGLAMQTVLILPWAATRKISEIMNLNPKKPFWEPESHDPLQKWQERFKAIEESHLSTLNELKRLNETAKKQYGATARGLAWLSLIPLKTLVLAFKISMWYPALLLAKLARAFAVFLFFCIYGPFDLSYRIWKKLEPVLGNSWVGRVARTTWRALAPHTWKRYFLGDPWGTLWDRGTGHSEIVLQQSRDAFNSLGYFSETITFGALHKIRIFGLLIVLVIALASSALLIEADQTMLDNIRSEEKFKHPVDDTQYQDLPK